MKLSKVIELLSAKKVTDNTTEDFDCCCACSSDLMSDVLAFSAEKSILLSGLNNIQVIRTAEMMDIKVVIFVRGKIPQDEIVEYALEKDIIVLSTHINMYEASGILYSNGLRGKS